VALSCRLDTLHSQRDDLIEQIAKALDINVELTGNPRRSQAIDPHKALVGFLFDNLQFCDEVGRRTGSLGSAIVRGLRRAAVQQLPSEPEMDLGARKCLDHGMVSIAAASVSSARRPPFMALA
jgi:hypothetical protein